MAPPINSRDAGHMSASDLAERAVGIAREAIASLRKLNHGKDELRAATRALLDAQLSATTAQRRVAVQMLLATQEEQETSEPSAVSLFGRALDAKSRGDLTEMRTIEALIAGFVSDDGANDDLDHLAHILRGKSFLAEGDIAEAERELLEAGMVRETAVLSSFGPDLSLAWALLPHAPQTSLEYFLTVSRYWSPLRMPS